MKGKSLFALEAVSLVCGLVALAIGNIIVATAFIIGAGLVVVIQKWQQ
ncbi:MAG: hypothetical protein Phog2KO_31240 [Phototrophicaceae bacterium]